MFSEWSYSVTPKYNITDIIRVGINDKLKLIFLFFIKISIGKIKIAFIKLIPIIPEKDFEIVSQK
jgi:hypothetical protein